MNTNKENDQGALDERTSEEVQRELKELADMLFEGFMHLHENKEDPDLKEE